MSTPAAGAHPSGDVLRPYSRVDWARSARVQRWHGDRGNIHPVRHPHRRREGPPIGAPRVGDPRGTAHPAAGHRPGRDQRLDRVLRLAGRRARPRAGALRDAASARARAPVERRRAGAAQHRLHQHDPPGARAVVPRRPRDRAPDPRVHPLERRRDGLQRQPQGPRGRRPHRDVPVVGEPLRGRLQPLLQGQGRARRRRPDLHPGPRLAGRLRPRLPRGPAERGAALPLPPGGPARRRARACRRTPTRA